MQRSDLVFVSICEKVHVGNNVVLGVQVVLLCSLLWRAIQDACETHLNLKVSIPKEAHFRSSEQVFLAIRHLLGERLQLMLHLDQTQVCHEQIRGTMVGCIVSCRNLAAPQPQVSHAVLESRGVKPCASSRRFSSMRNREAGTATWCQTIKGQ